MSHAREEPSGRDSYAAIPTPTNSLSSRQVNSQTRHSFGIETTRTTLLAENPLHVHYWANDHRPFIALLVQISSTRLSQTLSLTLDNLKSLNIPLPFPPMIHRFLI